MTWILACAVPILLFSCVTSTGILGLGNQQNKPKGVLLNSFGGLQQRNFAQFDPRRMFMRRPPQVRQLAQGPHKMSMLDANNRGIGIIRGPPGAELAKMRQKLHIKPMGSSPPIQAGQQRHDEDHKDGTVPVGELADSLRHLLGLRDGGKVMINFAVNKPTEHRTARGHLYIDSSNEQLRMPEFPDLSQQFKDDPVSKKQSNTKESEEENGEPGEIWKYLMDHSKPDKGNPEDQESESPNRPQRNQLKKNRKKNHQGTRGNKRPQAGDDDDDDSEVLEENPEKLTSKPGGSDVSEPFFDDDDEFDDSSNAGNGNDNREPRPNKGSGHKRPQKQHFRKKPNPQTQDEEQKAELPSTLPEHLDDEGRKNKPAFIPTAYEIHVQPVIATTSLEDTGNVMNSIHDEGKHPIHDFKVPVPNFPAHVNFGDGAFKLVHETDWTPIAADAAGFGSHRGPKRRPAPGRPVAGPSAFTPQEDHRAPTPEDGPSYESEESGPPNDEHQAEIPPPDDESSGNYDEEDGSNDPPPPPQWAQDSTTEQPVQETGSADGVPQGPNSESGSASATAESPPTYEYDSGNSGSDPDYEDEPYSEEELNEIKKYFDGFPQFDNNELNEKDEGPTTETTTTSSDYDEAGGSSQSSYEQHPESNHDTRNENNPNAGHGYAGLRHNNPRPGSSSLDRPTFEEGREIPAQVPSINPQHRFQNVPHRGIVRQMQSRVQYAQNKLDKPAAAKSQKRKKRPGVNRKAPFKRHSMGFKQPRQVQQALDEDKQELAAHAAAAANTSAENNVTVAVKQDEDVANKGDAVAADVDAKQTPEPVRPSPTMTVPERAENTTLSEPVASPETKVFSVRKIRLSS